MVFVRKISLKRASEKHGGSISFRTQRKVSVKIFFQNVIKVTKR